MIDQKYSAYFVSLGCPKNLVDSQVMLGLLEKDKYIITQAPEQADVIIVNTCSFIQASKEESIDTILEMADYKLTGVCKVLVVSGCMVQRYAEQLEKQMPEIDLMIGTGQYHRITELLTRHRKARELGDPLPNRTYVDQPAFIHSDSDPRMQTGSRYSAYLKLSEGCNRRCAFCIIPKLRGKVRSRSVDSLVTEARNLARAGVRELNLVAQDLTHYGIDTGYKENLEKLLPELCKVDGVEWIRLHYVYPDQFSDELVEIFSREKKIVKYLDMPIQHTVDRVLRKMGRGLTRERLFSLIAELRKRVPDVVFRTSIIVGFPGETEEDFRNLCRDLEELNLDYVGVFRFSREEGTRADQMADQVHISTRRRREKTLRNLLAEGAYRKQKNEVGKRVPVMIEGPSEQSDLLLQARTPWQAQEIDGNILINDLGGLSNLSPGDFIEVEITEALDGELSGSAIARATGKRFERAAQAASN